jgi:hypothetical protein
MRKGWLFIAVFLVTLSETYGQCAMCKAVAESGSEEISGIGEGLNLGILWLMMFPYLILGVLGYALYRHYQKNKTAPSQ